MQSSDIRKQLWDLRCQLDLRKRFSTATRKYRSLFFRKKLIADYLERNQVRKVQIGCGPNPLPGWMNTDIDVMPGVIYVNALKPLPLPDGFIDYIFSEHMIEHITYENGNSLLKEAQRVLKPGGRIRIATPNLEFLIRLHNEWETDLAQRYAKYSVDQFIPYPKAYKRGNVINNYFRNWGHRFIYDFEMLSLTLTEAGFEDIVRFAPKESDDAQFRNLETHGRLIGDEFNLLESMVVEARKP